MSVAITLHLLSAVIWVGGMFFAYMALRPAAAALLDPPMRLPLWASTFGKFFPWVWLSVILLLVTGYWMIFAVFGGMAKVGLYVHLMMSIGIVMMLLFAHVFFAPYRRMKQAIIIEDWQEGSRRLGQIRTLIAVNLSLGIIVIIIATAGKYLA